MRRTEARELLMQMLYEMDIQDDFSIEKRNRFLENNGADLTKDRYFTSVHEACADNKEEIDEMINKYGKKWTIKTMNRVDVAILRLAISEIFFSKAVPASVAINEAVELGKKFGGDNSGKFINGVLGTIARESVSDEE